MSLAALAAVGLMKPALCCAGLLMAGRTAGPTLLPLLEDRLAGTDVGRDTVAFSLKLLLTLGRRTLGPEIKLMIIMIMKI